MVGGKSAFWQALVFTVLIFLIGLFLGFLVENSRVNSVESALYNSEINLLDQQIRDKVVGSFNVSCDVAKQELFKFADSIYEEASQLEKYDGASKFESILPIIHKRYDLLRVMLWTESKQLNVRCPNSFHRVVYLYNYGVDDSSQRGLQSFYSRLLIDLKERNGDNVLLIPIAANLNISSMDVLMSSYNITKTPAIFIDEKRLITEPPTIEQLQSYVRSQ
jgi:hypothetical protein